MEGEEGYRVRTSPRAECRKPRRRSSWCRSPGRCSRAPSTSPAGAPDRGETLWVTRRRSIERATYHASCCFTHVSSHNVVGVVVDVPGQPKVADFDQPAFRHQNVSCRQVSVDTLWRINEAVNTICVIGYLGWPTECRKRSSMYVIEGCKCFI